MKAVECLRLQGIFLPEDIAAGIGFDDKIMKDMAGNAFNLVSFQTVLLSWIVTIGFAFASDASKESSPTIECLESSNEVEWGET